MPKYINITTYLSSVLTSNQYAVNVEIIATQPKIPEFDKKNDEDLKEKKAINDWAKELEALIEKTRETDKKLERSVAEIELRDEAKKIEESKKEQEKNKKLDEKINTPKIKYTDEKPDEKNFGNAIVLSKFGMEAPLVDDFNDLRPDGKIVLTMNDGANAKTEEEVSRLRETLKDKEKTLKQLDRELQKTDREMQRSEREFGLKEAALINKIRIVEADKLNKDNEVSPTEQVWKYNNSVDVFKNLQEVNIRVRLSSGLSEELKQKVESYVRGMKFNLGRVIPNVKFEYALMGSDLAKPSDAQLFKEWLDLFSKYSTLIGLVLSVALLGWVGTKLIQKYFDLNVGKNDSTSGNLKMENSKDQDKTDKNVEVGAVGGAGNVLGLNGIDRLKLYLKSTPNEAIFLIKKWISSDEKASKDAIRAISQQMDNAELSLIFSILSSRQKIIWKDLLNHPLPDQELHVANSFISNQVIQNVIIPTSITDPQIFDLILKLTPDKVVGLVRHEPVTAAILMNILSGSFINEVLAKCSDADRNTVINESINLTHEQIINGQNSLKEALKSIIEEKELKPFLDKMLSLVHMATPKVEEALHTALGKNFKKDQLNKLGMEIFPAVLINDLPVGFLKTIIMNYPKEKRIRMLFSLGNDVRSFYVSIIAPNGTKAFEMVKLDFDNIKRDALEVEKIKLESEQIWFEFVTFVRNEIKDDKTYTRDVVELVSGWADDISKDSKDSKKSRTHLKVA